MLSQISTKNNSGFTLIEMIVVIVVAGVLSYTVYRTFVLPFHAFEDQSRRAELVSLADAALTQIARDLRSAVPNSVRVMQSGSVYSLEMLRVKAGGRYRYVDDTTDTVNNGLSPSNADSAFNVLGNVGSVSSTDRVVVNSNNTAALYSAAATGSGGMITPSATTLSATTVGSEQNLVLSAAMRFDSTGLGSPRKRFYLSDTAITYRCDPSTREIRRYVNYNVAATQTTAVPGGSDSDLLVNGVSACAFNYSSGSAARASLATLSLTLSEVKAYSTTATQEEESISLVHQVHVNNAP